MSNSPIGSPNRPSLYAYAVNLKESEPHLPGMAPNSSEKCIKFSDPMTTTNKPLKPLLHKMRALWHGCVQAKCALGLKSSFRRHSWRHSPPLPESGQLHLPPKKNTPDQGQGKCQDTMQTNPFVAASHNYALLAA